VRVCVCVVKMATRMKNALQLLTRLKRDYDRMHRERTEFQVSCMTSCYIATIEIPGSIYGGDIVSWYNETISWYLASIYLTRLSHVHGL
jgi:hypothetical protein